MEFVLDFAILPHMCHHLLFLNISKSQTKSKMKPEYSALRTLLPFVILINLGALPRKSGNTATPPRGAVMRVFCHAELEIRDIDIYAHPC
jgi:hypothetical protein